MAGNDSEKTKKDMEEKKNLGFKNSNLHEYSIEERFTVIRSITEKSLKKSNDNISRHENLASSQLPLTKSSSDFGKPPPSSSSLPSSPITGFLKSLSVGEFNVEDLVFDDNNLDDLDHEDSSFLDWLEEPKSNQDLGLGFQTNNFSTTDSLQTPTPLLLQHGSLQALPQSPVTVASDFNQNTDAKNDTSLEIQEAWNQDLGLGFQTNNFSSNIDITDSLQTPTPLLLQHRSLQALLQSPIAAASDFSQNTDAKNDTSLEIQEAWNQDLGLGFQTNNFSSNIDITDSLQTPTPLLLQHGSLQALPQSPVTVASDFNQNTDAKNDTLHEIQEAWNNDLGFQGNLIAEESGQGSTASSSISTPVSKLSEFKG